MDLFSNGLGLQQNLLPCDGTLNYLGPIFSTNEANTYFELLLSTSAWNHDEVQIFGKKIKTARKVAWYGDSEFEYTYSGSQKRALLWTQPLLELKTKVEAFCEEPFNSCLLNLYHHGKEGMGWHSDDEKDLKPNGTLASLSFGAERKFRFKHKINSIKIDLSLEHGSLLLMKNEIQQHWLHALPTTAKVLKPRINLTFRTILR